MWKTLLLFITAQKAKVNKECKDHAPKCRSWAEKGDCLHYAAYMMDVCKKSCKLCGPGKTAVLAAQ
jgi:hypothetical protein